MVTLRVTNGSSASATEAARTILAAAETHDGQSAVSDQAFVATAQGKRELLLFRVGEGAVDSAVSETTQPVAFGIVGEGEIDLVVTPEARGRGIGTAALAHLLPRTEGQQAPLLAWAHGTNPAAEALLTRAGFAPQRSLYRMELDPQLLPPASASPFSVPLPEGFTLRPFDAAHDAPAWVALNAAAFATHPEQGRITLDDFALMRQEPWFDAADLFLLDSDAGLAGYTWVKTVISEAPSDETGTPLVTDTGASETATELYAVGVDPRVAGQGLGRALLGVTLARMAELHPTHVELYVDGENKRAVDMYERAGFTIASRSRQFARS